MHGRTALHHCVENADTVCAELLLKTDPSLLSTTDGEGLTPLHMAVIAGNVPLIRLLLKRGASLQCRDEEEHTVAHWATGTSPSEGRLYSAEKKVVSGSSKYAKAYIPVTMPEVSVQLPELRVHCLCSCIRLYLCRKTVPHVNYHPALVEHLGSSEEKQQFTLYLIELAGKEETVDGSGRFFSFFFPDYGSK